MSQKQSALVVDDNAMVLMQATEILEDAGFDVSTAYDAEAALEVLEVLEARGAAFVLLFTDVEMPGAMNGFALARTVAQRWPSISILVASGQMTPKEGDMPPGAVFIGKPFSAEVVHGHVHKVLPDDKKPGPLKGLVR